MTIPKAFISYSWDDKAHKTWVRNLAILLRKDGVDVTLDQWHVQPGDQLPAFMERASRECDFVLIVCTPKYKAKSDGRSGGVGYEGHVIQGEVFTQNNHRKFIPILRRGTWTDAAPTPLLGKAYISLQDTRSFQANYQHLVRTLHAQVVPAPELGSRPNFLPEPQSLDGPKSIAASQGDNEVTLYGTLTDWAASPAQRRKALKMLGLQAREATAFPQKEQIATRVVAGLFDNNTSIREMAAAILIEIGSAAIRPILGQELSRIPGKEHGYQVAMDIFVAMSAGSTVQRSAKLCRMPETSVQGKSAVEKLVECIDDDIYVISGALCKMPFPEYVQAGCKKLFLRREMHGRYREEIARVLYRKGNWQKDELPILFGAGMVHSDPLVRVLAAEWHVSAFPKSPHKTLRGLMDDQTVFERFYDRDANQDKIFKGRNATVGQWVGAAVQTLNGGRKITWGIRGS